MLTDTEKGYRAAAKITKDNAKTFYLASFLLNRQKRLAAYAVYAICQISDNSVDSNSGAKRAQELDKIKNGISLAYADTPLNDPLLLAFRETIRRYAIARKYFDALIEAMQADIEKTHYRDFDQLYDYCYKAAGVVGLIMLEIFGYNKEAAKECAVKLGVAMQLTNILRDIKEDFGRGRIYLPLEEMHSYGVTEADILAKNLSPNLKNLLVFQAQRTRQYYDGSKDGIKMIRGASCRLAACVMKGFYSGILDEIEKNGYDIFARRAGIKDPGKIALILKIILKGQYL